MPVYNTVCTGIVDVLLDQCKAICRVDELFRYEVLVADDASTDAACRRANEAIAQKRHCRYLQKPENTGSAATRNFLARQAQYEWLLFLDCDMQIQSDRFLLTYLEQEGGGLVNGGIAIGPGSPTNLRYLYEKKMEQRHLAAQRSQRPYQSFRSTNFMVARETILSCPFDERFARSGYEDVMLGKQLRQHGMDIQHIDNPTVMTDFEPNPQYMDKIDRSLQTLHVFRHELRGYSRLLTLVEGIHIGLVLWLLRAFHKLIGPLLRRNLCGDRPRLGLFNLYRLGYYLNIN